MFTMEMLKVIVLACNLHTDGAWCYKKVMECYDENFTQSLQQVKPRTLAHCINKTLSKGQK